MARTRPRRLTFHVEPSFLVMGAIFGLLLQDLVAIVVWVAVLFVSITIHELGHAVAFLAFGSNAEIRLHATGGLTMGRGDLSPARSIVVSLAGSVTGIVVLGLPALALRDPAATGYGALAMDMLVFASLGWSFVNLLPVLPLDGGNVMREVLGITKPERAEELSRMVSIGAAALAGVWAISRGQQFGAIYALLFVGENWRALSALRKRELWSEVRRIHGAVGRGHVDDAEADANELLARPNLPPEVRAALDDAKAWIAVLRGQDPGEAVSGFVRAVAALGRGEVDRGVQLSVDAYRSSPQLPPNRVVATALHEAGADAPVAVARALVSGPSAAEGLRAAADLQTDLHEIGAFRDAVAVGEAMFAAWPQAQTAYNLACSYARLGGYEESIAWVARAVDAGLDDAQGLDNDPDLAVLRGDPRLAELRARVRGRS